MIRPRFYFSGATAAVFATVAVGLSSCNRSQNTAPPDAHQAQLARGRAVYQSVCTACHNSDPKKAGSLGPEVWGSSLELLQARVTGAGYPAGYTPKRQTHVMQPLPQVQKDLPAIQAFLNSP